MTYVYLAIAVIAEGAATSALKASEEFTKLVPSLFDDPHFADDSEWYYLCHVVRIGDCFGCPGGDYSVSRSSRRSSNSWDGTYYCGGRYH